MLRGTARSKRLWSGRAGSQPLRPHGRAKLVPEDADLLYIGALAQALCDTCSGLWFRFLVLDSPPLGTVADCELLQLAADGLILVVRFGHTDRQLLKRAFSTPPKAKPLGVDSELRRRTGSCGGCIGYHWKRRSEVTRSQVSNTELVTWRQAVSERAKASCCIDGH